MRQRSVFRKSEFVTDLRCDSRRQTGTVNQYVTCDVMTEFVFSVHNNCAHTKMLLSQVVNKFEDGSKAEKPVRSMANFDL